MKYKLAFVCVHNSCRSQMAEGWAKELGSDIFEVYSAGTEEYHEVKPLAVEVMKEAGVDISNHKPKLLSDIPYELDILITMGCNVVCPFVPNKFMQDWGLDDPTGKGDNVFLEAIDTIERKILELKAKISCSE